MSTTTITPWTSPTALPCCCGGCSYGNCVFSWSCTYDPSESSWGDIEYVGVDCVATADQPTFGTWAQNPDSAPCLYLYYVQGDCCPEGDTSGCGDPPDISTIPDPSTQIATPLCCCDPSIWPNAFSVAYDIKANAPLCPELTGTATVTNIGGGLTQWNGTGSDGSSVILLGTCIPTTGFIQWQISVIGPGCTPSTMESLSTTDCDPRYPNTFAPGSATPGSTASVS